MFGTAGLINYASYLIWRPVNYSTNNFIDRELLLTLITEI
ncbi:MAG: hypothetical protein JWO32_2509 [Bacteroidetes bacterium]|nr:hypothetical protein [Bacteroidota bacterium]